jgi:hypothetical protein
MDRNRKAKDSQGTHSQLLTPLPPPRLHTKVRQNRSLSCTSGLKNRLTRDEPETSRAGDLRGLRRIKKQHCRGNRDPRREGEKSRAGELYGIFLSTLSLHFCSSLLSSLLFTFSSLSLHFLLPSSCLPPDLELVYTPRLGFGLAFRVGRNGPRTGGLGAEPH